MPGAANAVLVIGRAGGVGSIATQLAQAQRLHGDHDGFTPRNGQVEPQSRRPPCRRSFEAALDGDRAAGDQAACLVFSTTNTGRHLAEIAKLIAPQGRFALIDDPASIEVSLSRLKSVSTHREFMFKSSMFGTVDIAEQGALLNEVARLVDAGTLKTTLAERFGSFRPKPSATPMR